MKFTPHTADSAPQEAKPILEGIQKSMGFTPNLLAIMAEAPALLEGYMTLAAINDKSSFSETEQQIILMTNNIQNGCTYCMAAHTTISQMKGVEPEVIEALRTQAFMENKKYEALRDFTKIVNETRGYPTEGQLKEFFDAGYNKQHVLEVILGTALKVMSNYTNHIAKTELDEEFSPNRWSGDSVNAA